MQQDFYLETACSSQGPNQIFRQKESYGIKRKEEKSSESYMMKMDIKVDKVPTQKLPCATGGLDYIVRWKNSLKPARHVRKENQDKWMKNSIP